MSEDLKKIGIPAATTLASALLLMAPMLAFAVSPHFISASSGLSGSSLTCTFKEAGLGNLGSTNIDETCSASASAVYVCVNNGGNHPQAANKETVNTVVSNTGTFPIRNGQTTGTITVAAPGAGDFSCPNGQTLALSSVTYTNVQICDELGNCVKLADQTFTDTSVPT